MSADLAVGVVGAGAWGRALADLAAAAGASVMLGQRTPAPSPHATSSVLRDVAAHARLLFLAVPARDVAQALDELLPGPEHRLVLASRGLDPTTARVLSRVVAERSACVRLGVLAGPALAADVAEGVPSAAVVASRYEEVCALTQRALHSPRFRVYTSDDPYAVEVAAALSRVLAALVGMTDGLGPGVRGVVVSRGLAEAQRFMVALGADPTVLSGLAGVGELVASISRDDHPSVQSGRLAARGQGSVDDETLATAEAALRVASSHGVDLPLTGALVAMARQELTLDSAIRGLMERAAKKGER